MRFLAFLCWARIVRSFLLHSFLVSLVYVFVYEFMFSFGPFVPEHFCVAGVVDLVEVDFEFFEGVCDCVDCFFHVVLLAEVFDFHEVAEVIDEVDFD